jgi:hypothetical protein
MSTFWEELRKLEGETISTLHRAKRFLITAVEDDRVRFKPGDGKGTERSVPRTQIEHIANLRLSRDELRSRTQQEYPKNQNTSYIAALAFEARPRLGLRRD